jgi:hypothetical protein
VDRIDEVEPIIPGKLQAHVVWYSGDKPRYVYVTERRWRRGGIVITIAGLAVTIAGFVFFLHSPVPYAAVGTTLCGAAASMRGTRGFYSVQPDGTLGEFIAGRPPDLRGLSRRRVRRRALDAASA